MMTKKLSTDIVNFIRVLEPGRGHVSYKISTFWQNHSVESLMADKAYEPQVC